MNNVTIGLFLKQFSLPQYMYVVHVMYIILIIYFQTFVFFLFYFIFNNIHDQDNENGEKIVGRLASDKVITNYIIQQKGYFVALLTMLLNFNYGKLWVCFIVSIYRNNHKIRATIGVICTLSIHIDI